MQIGCSWSLRLTVKDSLEALLRLSFPSEARNKPRPCHVPISSNLQHPRKGGRRLMGLGKSKKLRKLAQPRMLGKLQG